MKNSKLALSFCGLLMVLLTSCSSAAASPITQTVFEMESTENYDESDASVNTKLFCATENAEVLNLDISFQMEGENGSIEIADKETKEILWSKVHNETTETTTLTVTLDALDKEKDYVVQLTGGKIHYAKIVARQTDLSKNWRD